MQYKVCIRLVVEAVVTVDAKHTEAARRIASEYLTSEIDPVVNGDNDNTSDIEGSVVGTPEILWVSDIDTVS